MNIIANLILIPLFGIVGAAAASLVSYSLSSLLLTLAAARFSRTSVADFWVPRVSDVRFASPRAWACSADCGRVRAASRDERGAQT